MKFKVSGLQINNGFSGNYYLPYSIGLLSTYYENYSEQKEFSFDQMIYKRDEIKKIVDHISSSKILLFSTYVWNINISLEIARRTKEIDPDKIVIFGGPSVPDHAEQFLKKYKYIDVACHQEGERKLTNLLDGFHSEDWKHTPGISFLENNCFVTNKDVPRVRDLEQIPSPYLSDAFEKLMLENKESWLASWETNRGCPFSCAYCDWGSATNSKVSKMEMERLKKELEWFGNKKIEFVFVCDANFGMLPRDYEIVQHAIKIKKQYGYPHVLSVQATKNARERSYKIQKLLFDGDLHKSVNIAMQATDKDTLKNIKRDNISLKDYEDLQRRFIKDGIPTYSDLIIGLPGDNFEKFKASLDQLFRLGQHYRVQFNNLSILPNAPMAAPAYINEHDIRTVKIPVVSMHGSLEDKIEDDVYEEQALLVHHKEMGYEEWRRIRTFASAVEFFYYDKMLQVPLIIGCCLENIELSEVVEQLLKSNEFKSLKKVNSIFEKNTKDILKGGFEFMQSRKWLNIYWPPGELAILKLIESKMLEQFYEESTIILQKIFKKNNLLIEDAANYNKFILKKPKNFKEKKQIETNYDIAEIYKIAKEKGFFKDNEVVRKKVTYRKNITEKMNQKEWARKVVWYGHRNAAYFEGENIIRKDIAGHY